MTEKIYPKGIIAFAPRQGAPNFVLGTVIITPNELFKWLKENQNLLTEHNGEKQIRLDLTRGDNGRPSFAVDTWKPETKTAQEPAPTQNETDLPF